MKNPLKAMKAEWDEMSPSNKAWTLTITIAAAAINPLYPVIYGSAYAIYSATNEKEDVD